MEPAARLEQVSYYYPGADRAALLNIDLEIRPGEMVGVIGATGSGKTTLCLALNGIVPQLYGGRFFGRVTVAGRDTLEHPISALASQVGMVMQDPESQIVTASVENEVALALENLRVPRPEMRARIAEALAAVNLAGLEARHPHELSGGQQQRLALAAAFAVRPALIVLDEPTSQLDPRSTADLFALVRRLCQARGTACLVTGHASEEMAETAGRILVLSRGRLVAAGSPAEVYRDLPLLAREHLRPPEVTAAFSRLAERGVARGPVPVRLADGLAALPALPVPAAFSPAEAPRPAGEPPLLEARDVHYTYPDGTAALRGVSLEIRRGEYVAVLGQNGAGKSSLIRHFLKFMDPSQGELRIGGEPLAGFTTAQLARRIGYVPQNPDRQIFSATVEEEVAFSLRGLPLSPEEKEARTARALGALGLAGQRRSHPFSLSKGDRARVVIAAVLIMEPELLVFDEPTTGQDDAGARAILDLTRELNQAGRTIVVVTHHLSLMPPYARRVLLLGGGRVLLDGPLRAAYHAVDLLAQTDLRPTQAVALARASRPGNLAVTAEEFAGTYALPP